MADKPKTSSETSKPKGKQTPMPPKGKAGKPTR